MGLGRHHGCCNQRASGYALCRPRGRSIEHDGYEAVLEHKGLPCSLYGDRGAHYWSTPKAGGKVDKVNLTQFGQSMQRLGIEMIAAHSPQARGRSERAFKTHQGKLPQEFSSSHITSMIEANRYLEQVYLPAFNKRFAVSPSEAVTAFVPIKGFNLTAILSECYERVVGNDNCVSFENLKLQIPADTHCHHYVRAKVQVSCERGHLPPTQMLGQL